MLIFGKTSAGLVVPVNVDSNGNIQTVLTGLYSGAQQRAPIPFGPSASLIKRYSNLSLAAGTNTLDSDAVPVGELWILTLYTMLYQGTPPTWMVAKLVSGADDPNILRVFAPASLGTYGGSVNLIMQPGDKFRVTVAGATANDDLYLDLMGYKMDIDQ